MINKKIVIVMLLMFFSVTGLFILAKQWNIFYCFNKESILESENLSVEQIIIESINIQYRGGDKKELDRIFTSDFIKEINLNPKFYKKKIFYTYDKNFMKSFKNINQNQAKVSVTVEDLSGSYIEIITLTKNSDNIYLVSKIEVDI